MTTRQCGTDKSTQKLVSGAMLEIDGKRYPLTGFSIDLELTPGDHQIKASLPGNPIAKLAFVHSQGVNRQIYHADAAGIAKVALDARGDNWEARPEECGAVLPPQQQEQAPERARIADTGGSIKVIRRRGDKSAEMNAPPGFILREGDEIYVSGTARMDWIGGGTIKFENERASTRIIIGSQKPIGTEARRPSLQLLDGVIHLLFPGDTAKKNKFEASTGTVWCTVKGTDYTLGYNERARISEIKVSEGTVEVAPLNPAVPAFMLGAGRAAKVSSTNAVSGPVGGDGTTTTTSASAFPKNTPIRVCEHFPTLSKTVCGTWTWDGGNQIIYRLDEGNVAILNVERLDQNEIILSREDRTNPYGIYRARYSGRISGNGIRGDVSVTMGDIKSTNRWTAQW